MEKNIIRKTLSFAKGMSNTPSDLLCEDADLLECEGFICSNGEMKAIQSPVKIGTISDTVMYVHKGADYENIICKTGTKSIACYKKIDGKIDVSSKQTFVVSGNGAENINSIGNTLICSTSEGLHYLLYKGGKYKNLGTELPTPSMEFYFTHTQAPMLSSTETACELAELCDGYTHWVRYETNEKGVSELKEDRRTDENPWWLNYTSSRYDILSVKTEKIDDYNNALQGHVSRRIKKLKEDGYFMFPFFIRYALKLFDGSYARISAPMAMYPSSTKNCRFTPVSYAEIRGWSESDEATPYRSSYAYIPVVASLNFQASINNLADWTDIVKELVVFASDDVMTFKLEGNWTPTLASASHNESYFKAPYINEAFDEETHWDYFWFYPDADMQSMKGFRTLARSTIEPEYKSDREIIKELVSKSQFYRLFSIKTDDSALTAKKIKPATIGYNVLNNLIEQEQLPVDDYFGWTKIVANKTYVYNKRLNIFNLERSVFGGFNIFSNSPYQLSMTCDFQYYTHIVSDKIDTWVKCDKKYTNFYEEAFVNGWLYYPDPNATEMIIWDTNSNKGMRVALIQHPMLNGAYSFNSLPTGNTFVADDTVTIPSCNNDAKEYFNSQIYTSVVNNPFVFEASGDNTVGTGEILGIMANTEAVSQGQFGQYPLIVFTSEGIYGLSVNSEGLYSSCHPISREVGLTNSPFVPTDKLVFFVSKKGLMGTTGGQVQCVSEQMRGKISKNFSTVSEGKFLEFLDGCQIAYDYRDSLLRIFKEGKSYQYIFNMIDQSFFVDNSGIMVKTIVNDYPDNLIQDIYGNVYSLMSKPDINDDTEKFDGQIITRPLKLGGSITLKSLRAIKHLFDTDEGKVSMEVWGSNDCKHWQKLTGVGGKPWKYFTFKYTLKDFKAIDSFAGSIVEIQSRREDKIR